MQLGRKKIFVTLALIFLTVLFSFSCEAAKKVVAVMPLEVASSYNNKNVSEIMTEQLLNSISDSGIYTVVERQYLDKVFNELGLQNIATENPVEMGKMFGANFVVVGKVTMLKTEATSRKTFLDKVKRIFTDPYKTTISMDLRFVECRSGAVNLARSIIGEAGGKDETLSVHNACKDAATKFMQEIQAANPFLGRVIGVSGNDIYVDQGIDSGIHKGEVLIVAREGEVITSVDGQAIGTTQTVIGKAKVTEITADFSICRIVEGDSSSVKVNKGDIVKRSN